MGEWSYLCIILNLGTRRRWVVSLTLQLRSFGYYKRHDGWTRRMRLMLTEHNNVRIQSLLPWTAPAQQSQKRTHLAVRNLCRNNGLKKHHPHLASESASALLRCLSAGPSRPSRPSAAVPRSWPDVCNGKKHVGISREKQRSCPQNYISQSRGHKYFTRWSVYYLIQYHFLRCPIVHILCIWLNISS